MATTKLWSGRDEFKYSLIHAFATCVTESLIMPFTEKEKNKPKRGEGFPKEYLQFGAKETLVDECGVREGSRPHR